MGLPGHLRRNPLVLQDFNAYGKIPHFWQIAYSEILSLANDPNVVAVSNQYVCETCLTRFLQDNVYTWYVHRKMDEGEHSLSRFI